MKSQDFHPRIYPANYPILTKYPSNHPACELLQAQAEVCDLCVGKEIVWPNAIEESVDQRWYSSARDNEQLFSNFAYEFLSYDLVLDGWLHMSAEATESEVEFLTKDEITMRALLNECETAARTDGNVRILPLINKAREFVNKYSNAILHRFEVCNVRWPQKPES